MRGAKVCLLLVFLGFGLRTFYLNKSTASRDRLVNTEIANVRQEMNARKQALGSYSGGISSNVSVASHAREIKIFTSIDEMPEEYRDRLPQASYPMLSDSSYRVVIVDGGDNGKLIVVTPDEITYY